MKYKAVIFDMDGTIIDSEPIWQHGIQELLARRGIQLNQKQQQTLQEKTTGLSLAQTCQLLRKTMQLNDSLPQLMQEKQAISIGLLKTKVRFIYGFTSFHKKVATYKLKTALATNAQQITLHNINSALNLQQFFGNHMYSVSDVNNCAKPDPALYIHTTTKLKVSPAASIAIEDSAHGIRAAKQAGLFCIGFNSAKNKALLQEADYIVDTYDEINLEILLYTL